VCVCGGVWGGSGTNLHVVGNVARTQTNISWTVCPAAGAEPSVEYTTCRLLGSSTYTFRGTGRCKEIVSEHPAGGVGQDWTEALQRDAEAWCNNDVRCVGFMHHVADGSSNGDHHWNGRPQFCSSVEWSANEGWEHWTKDVRSTVHCGLGTHCAVARPRGRDCDHTSSERGRRGVAPAGHCAAATAWWRHGHAGGDRPCTAQNHIHNAPVVNTRAHATLAVRFLRFVAHAAQVACTGYQALMFSLAMAPAEICTASVQTTMPRTASLQTCAKPRVKPAAVVVLRTKHTASPEDNAPSLARRSTATTRPTAAVGRSTVGTAAATAS